MIYQYNKSDDITLQNVTVIQRTYQNSEVTTECGFEAYWAICAKTCICVNLILWIWSDTIKN